MNLEKLTSVITYYTMTNTAERVIMIIRRFYLWSWRANRFHAICCTFNTDL